MNKRSKIAIAISALASVVVNSHALPRYYNPTFLQSLKNAITNLDVETVRIQIENLGQADPITVPMNLDKTLLNHAEMIKTGLRADLYKEAQKSRLWSGTKACIQAFFAFRLFDVAKLLKSINILLKDIQNPKIILGNLIRRVKGTEEAPALLTSVSTYALVTWACENAPFAYRGTSQIEQKLTKIDQIIEILNTYKQAPTGTE